MNSRQRAYLGSLANNIDPIFQIGKASLTPEIIEALEVKAEEMAKKYDCPFVDNEMPYGRVPQGHPVIVDYFYHEEIRGTENTGKRNR